MSEGPDVCSDPQAVEKGRPLEVWERQLARVRQAEL